MATFTYLALDQKGDEQQGQIEAQNQSDATTQLRGQVAYLISVTEDSGLVCAPDSSAWRHSLGLLSPRQFMPASSQELVFLFRQTAMMLHSGYTILQALEANQSMTSKRRLKQALADMGEDIRGGSSFSAAMEKIKMFPPQAAKLLAAGEQSGEIDTILQRLAEDIERRQEIKRQLSTALTYPGIVFFMAVGVSAGLVGWVIPRFATFLTSRGTALPPLTQFLLDFAAWFEVWGATLGVLLVLSVLGIAVASTTRGGKTAIDRVVLRLPLVGNVVTTSSMAQATWSLAMQLRSGITLLNALNITRDIMKNLIIADAFNNAAEKILAGQPLSMALRADSIPFLVTHQAALGERSGELDNVMEELGEFYHKELQARVKTMAAWVEPVLILVVGLLVGVVYLAFFQAALKVSTGGI